MNEVVFKVAWIMCATGYICWVGWAVGRMLKALKKENKK